MAFLPGCASVRPVDRDWADPQVDLVWPGSPAEPRIRFLRAITGPADFHDESQTGRFFRWIVGEKKQQIQLNFPYGVAADGEGKVWVTDTGSRIVHVFDLVRNRVDYLANAGNEPFLSPIGVTVDSGRRRLYVSDSVLKKVFLFDHEGSFLGFRQPPGGFGRPAGLATDTEGNLYVVDVLKGEVEVFSAAGDYLRSIGSTQTSDGKFNRPSNVFVDGSGRVFVTDSMNFRVEIIGSQGEPLGTIGQLGDVPGAFARPRGVAVDSEGHVYVADAAFDNLQIFDAAGRLLLYFGGLGRGPGKFNLPAGLYFDRNDRLYVVDAFNHRVQIFQYLAENVREN